MASTELVIDGIGQVKIFRRKGLRSIRVTIGRDGRVRLSIPWYVPKAAGISYLLTKKAWINQHQPTEPVEWRDGQSLTSKYILRIHTSSKKNLASRVSAGILNVYLPAWQDKSRRQESLGGCVGKFLKVQAEKELVPLLHDTALANGFTVKGVRIRNLKSRWGSCNQHKVITLNSSLVQLSDELACYVICHELAHTSHLNHSPRFWQEVGTMIPDYKERRKELRQFNPALIL